MEKESKLTEKFKRNVLGMAAGSLIAIAAFNGATEGEIKTIHSTYQGYMADPSEGKNYLVFDDKPKTYRTPGTEDLVISGNPDTLQIGKDYAVEYLIPKWKNIFPKKLKDIR